MDIAGAEALRWRLAQQEHWQTAHAVRLGMQPSIDPDGHSLESFHGGLRIYRCGERTEIVDGRLAVASCWIRKRLVDGEWREDVMLETGRRVA